MPWTVLLYSLVFAFIQQSTCNYPVNNQELGKNITKILDSFFDSGKYDKRVRPNYGGTPVEVGVTLHILTISSVSEVQMDFTTDFYFRQVWTDSRLAFTETERIRELSVGAEVADKIWVPDTFFANEKSAYFHEATTMNTFLRIGSTGKVYRSIRLTVTANCPMDLQYFPMDRQKCTVEIESYGYSMSDIIYFWKDGEKSIGIDESLTLPQFSVAGIKQRDKKVVLSTGNYSRLLCEIQLIRSMGYYMIQIYVPASLIVMISWVSFWLHRNATPARVQLGVVTVLTMTTLMSSTNSQLPKISYVKSIDVFLGTSFVMVFAALLEYAAVGYIGKRISMRKNRYQQLAKAANEKRRKLILDQHTQSNNQVMTSTGYLDHLHYLPGCESLVLPNQSIQQYVQLSGNNMLSTATQSSFAQPNNSQTVQIPTSSNHLNFHPVAPYATIRRNVLERTGSLGCSANTNSRIIQRPHEVRLEMIGSKALSVAQSTEDNLCNTGLTNNCNLRKNCTQSSNNLLNQQLIQRNVPSALNTAGLNSNNVPHHLHSIIPTSSANNINTPQHIDHHTHHSIVQKRSLAKATSTGKVHSSSPSRNLNNLFGVSPSDIDKYSRVVFPVCFVCFNLIYWVIFMHISNLLESDFDAED